VVLSQLRLPVAVVPLRQLLCSLVVTEQQHLH
jgi:hypothetical protein